MSTATTKFIGWTLTYDGWLSVCDGPTAEVCLRRLLDLEPGGVVRVLRVGERPGGWLLNRIGERRPRCAAGRVRG